MTTHHYRWAFLFALIVYIHAGHNDWALVRFALVVPLVFAFMRSFGDHRSP